MKETRGVALKILGKEFQVMCPKGAEHELIDAAHYLDNKMSEIRNAGRVIGMERIAVMAALNIAHELLQRGTEKDEFYHGLSREIERLHDKMGTVLTEESTADQGME